MAQDLVKSHGRLLAGGDRRAPQRAVGFPVVRTLNLDVLRAALDVRMQVQPGGRPGRVVIELEILGFRGRRAHARLIAVGDPAGIVAPILCKPRKVIAIARTGSQFRLWGSTRRHRAREHGDIAIEPLHLLRLRQAHANAPRPLDYGRGAHDLLCGMFRGYPRSAGVPAAAQVHAQHDAQPVRLVEGVLVKLAPLGTHEVRPPRRVGPGLAGVEQQRPGDPLFFHLLEVAGNALLAGRAVEPPPVAPGFRGIRRGDEFP